MVVQLHQQREAADEHAVRAVRERTHSSACEGCAMAVVAYTCGMVGGIYLIVVVWCISQVMDKLIAEVRVHVVSAGERLCPMLGVRVQPFQACVGGRMSLLERDVCSSGWSRGCFLLDRGWLPGCRWRSPP